MFLELTILTNNISDGYYKDSYLSIKHTTKRIDLHFNYSLRIDQF